MQTRRTRRKRFGEKALAGALAGLKGACRSGENVMPHCIAAVKALADGAREGGLSF